MCVTSMNDTYTGLNCSGFGWKYVYIGDSGGFIGPYSDAVFHKTKWNHAQNRGQNHLYKPGFHIPLSLSNDLIGEANNRPRFILIYVEYKGGHTLGEDYGPCIVASQMRIISAFSVKKGKLIPYKDKQNVKVSKKKN